MASLDVCMGLLIATCSVIQIAFMFVSDSRHSELTEACVSFDAAFAFVYIVCDAVTHKDFPPQWKRRRAVTRALVGCASLLCTLVCVAEDAVFLLGPSLAKLVIEFGWVCARGTEFDEVLCSGGEFAIQVPNTRHLRVVMYFFEWLALARRNSDGTLTRPVCNSLYLFLVIGLWAPRLQHSLAAGRRSNVDIRQVTSLLHNLADVPLLRDP